MPRDGIQHLVAQLLEAAHDDMDIVMGTTNPNRAVVAQLGTAQSKPLAVELVDVFRCTAFVPIAFIHAYLLAAMHADAAIAEKVRRISKDGVYGVVRDSM